MYHGVYKGKEVVKKCEDAEEGDIIKGARFIHKLQHKNLVKFNVVCVAEKALMLEYVAFDLSAFGIDKKVSGSDVLLVELHKCRFEGFEHLVSHIVKDVISGLCHLHINGVTHRDIKPSNVLVGSQHCYEISSEERKKETWEKCPCIAKLTFFGESWGNICDTYRKF